MFGRFLKGSVFGSASDVGFPPVDVDRPLYAIGDVHGCTALLVELIDAIMQDHMSGEHADVSPEIVFVGDIVDKGNDAAGSVEFAMAMQGWDEIDTVFVVGNHEVMLLEFLEDPENFVRWIQYGGLETLMSYGVRPRDMNDPASLRAMAEDLALAMGPHVDFLRSMTPAHLNGSLLCVHAGADPDLPPELQPDDVLIWGLPAFYRQPRRDGIWVLHGHTIVEVPSIRSGRIAIDTGAYCNGTLTAARVLPGRIDFMVQSAGGLQWL